MSTRATAVPSRPRPRLVAGLLSGAAFATVLALSSSASAAKIKGKIENWRSLLNPVWTEGKEPKKHGYSFRETVPTVRAEFRALFPHIPKELCIAAISAAKQKPPPPILIRVGGGRTTPVTIVVPPATQLQFQNTDPFKHRLYGVKISSFTANDTVRGGVRGWAVPGPGVFEVRDENAPSLRMWIVGEPNVAAIAYPSMKGEFALTVQEPGQYTVQAYFAGAKVGAPRQVTVGGDDLDISREPIKVAESKKQPDDKDKDKDKDKKKEGEEKKEKEGEGKK